jgi:CIC family chloride channel protein
MQELWLFALMGMLMGLIGIAMIRALFFLEEAFDRFPFQPAAIWAPATGALMLGLIGYFYPQVFGTGYDTIRDMLNDNLGTHALLGISAAKFAALVVSLGSGTTGGVFAPSLIVGGGVGAVYAEVWHHFLPHLVSDPALYSLVAMAAMFGGIARAPFTSIVFLFELSRNPNALLPLVVCCVVSDGFVRLFSEESIMTGKLVKRGLIVRQEYSVPALLRARVQEVMRKNFTVVSTDDHVQAVIRDVSPEQTGIIPVIDGTGNLVGIIEAHDLLKGIESNPLVRGIMRQDYVIAHPGETVDEVSRDMVVHNVENIVVVEGHGLLQPIGVARAADILRLRRWVIEEEGFGNQPVRAKGSPPARV